MSTAATLRISCIELRLTYRRGRVLMMTRNIFLDALASSRRTAELDDVDDLFGFLIGSWDTDVVLYHPDGQVRRTRGEVHASWVLEGRAIQDLFIFPRRADRTAGASPAGDRYGTTIRTYDRKSAAWRVVFINPAAEETNAQLLARRDGAAIAMEGNLADGTPIRWRYEAVTDRSFHYAARRLGDDQNWRLYVELFGKRAD